MVSTINKPRRARLWLLALPALLAACSSTTFFYNRLDIILPWYLGRYVDLDRSQSRALDRQLDSVLRWHRSEELPRYVDLLAELERDLDAPAVSLSTVQFYTEAFEQAWYRTRDRFLEEMLLLGEGLSATQIDEFIATLEKKQRKYERKYLERDEEEYREDSFDELRDLLQDFLGRLDAQQRERAREAAAGLQRSDVVWLEERAQWIEYTAADLRRETGWQQRIRERVLQWEERLSPATLALYEHNTLQVQMAIVDVLNTRSERQDRRLRRKLAAYREDFELLVDQGSSAQQDAAR